MDAREKEVRKLQDKRDELANQIDRATNMAARKRLAAKYGKVVQQLTEAITALNMPRGVER